MKLKRTSVIKTLATVLFYTLLNPSCISAQKNYYLNASGNDNHDGLSPKRAWKTLDKINKTDFKPGDSILLEGATIFKGTIKLSSDDNGSVGQPITITSYGKSKAVINAGQGEGLLAINTSYLKLYSLSFVGAGVSRNHGSGIHFYANDSINTPSNIEITDCDVKGFSTYGIAFGANDNVSFKGYRQVRITHCNASENGEGGIASYGSHLGFQHKDFYLAYCKAFRNRGVLSKTHHSGNGIVMGMIDGLQIQYCEAFENGADNRCTAGGPVGIWVWMCKNATIQYCTSHDNYAGLTKDGGGFDIDGGSSSCIIQYNYSYNNEGAGYLLAEYGAVFPFTNNIIRFNISANDGRKNGYGAISVWGAAKGFEVTNTYIYNNTFYLDDKKIIDGRPAGITLMGPHFKNVIMANNIIATKGNVLMISADTTVNESAFLLLHNNYYSYTNQYNFKCGNKNFNFLQKWMANNPEEEKIKGQKQYININPSFNTKKITTPSAFLKGSQLKPRDFMLQSNSPLRKKKFLLSNYFQIFSNTTDYFNNNLPTDGGVIPGACIK